MKEALKHCRKHLGDNATILFDNYVPSSIKKMVKEQGKEAGGPWDCYDAWNYFGWETDHVVAVTNGSIIVELITRAKIRLSVILVRNDHNLSYAKTKEYFDQAVSLGLVQIVPL